MGQVCAEEEVHPGEISSGEGAQERGGPQEGVDQPRVRIRPDGHAPWWDLGEVWAYRDLGWALATRDLRLRYRQTALGVTWVVFQPLAGAGVFAFVFGSVLGLSPRGEGEAGPPNYFLFSLVGTLLWTVFASTLSKSSTALLGNASLVAKVYFPRILLPLATLLSTLVDLGIGAVAFGCVSLWTGRFPPWTGWLLFAGWASLAAAAALGLGLLASAVMSRLRDVQHVLPLLLPFLMYASPVGYSLERVPSEWRWIFELNPLTSVLEGGRAALLGHGGPAWTGVFSSACVSLLLLATGIWGYRRMEKGVSDVL